MAPVAATSFLSVGWTSQHARLAAFGPSPYQNLGEMVVRDIGELGAVILGDHELDMVSELLVYHRDDAPPRGDLRHGPC